jgi:hypothetical protein
MIGNNFVLVDKSKRNQKILIEKMVQKLTSVITVQVSSDSTSASRRSNLLLNNLSRNKLSLMQLCAQYVEPNDLGLFNQFYVSILNSMTSILIDNNDTLNMTTQKFSIITELLSKFSSFNLNKLAQQSQAAKQDQVCIEFVEANLRFLRDLKLDQLRSSQDVGQDEEQNRLLNKTLQLIVEQCIDNFVCILDIGYPFYFEYMLKKCLEFSSCNNNALKYAPRHLQRFEVIFRQNELRLMLQQSGLVDETKLTRSQFEKTFDFLAEYFQSERIRL